MKFTLDELLSMNLCSRWGRERLLSVCDENHELEATKILAMDDLKNIEKIYVLFRPELIDSKKLNKYLKKLFKSAKKTGDSSQEYYKKQISKAKKIKKEKLKHWEYRFMMSCILASPSLEEDVIQFLNDYYGNL